MMLPLIREEAHFNSPLANRIKKNYRHLRKWALRTNTNCFRIYDRDIKEYPVAIDYYDGKISLSTFLIDLDKEPPLVEEIGTILAGLLAIDEEDIFVRSHIKRKKLEQYEKQQLLGDFFEVVEHGVKFKVNLNSYLDTGLFLDHRDTRQYVGALAKGKSLLNLFSYTGAFSVIAASIGARATKSVDMSNTYTAWSKENFLLNGLDLHRNTVVRADCLVFLEEEISSRRKYDVIVIDPPTMSRSKKMEEMFDIQRDYLFLIEKGLQLLEEGGTLFFSTNSRKFKFDLSHFSDVKIQDVTKKTIPLDFHDQKIHQVWKINRG